MRIATWNLEWAKPGTRRRAAALDHLESIDADVLVTTEDSVHDWDAYPHRIDGGLDWGYPPVDGRRKVLAWSKTPWIDIEMDDDGSLRGRFVAATSTIEGMDLRVIAVCIPWRDAHVRTGRRDRKIWADHVEFCSRLGEILTEVDGQLVVAGDFNQRVPRRRQPQYVFDSLMTALGSNTIDTAGDFDVGRLVDHVASSGHITPTAILPWPNVIEGRRITDHSGVAVDYDVISSH